MHGMTNYQNTRKTIRSRYGSRMNTAISDVIIIGGGLVGSAMATALAQSGLSVQLLERAERDAALDASGDIRATAIARSSMYVFEHIGVWDQLTTHAEPILDIRVLDGYSHAFVHYDHSTADNKPFGYIVSNTQLKPTLLQAAEKEDNITITYGAEVTDIETTANHATVTLADGNTLRAALVLAADGRFSASRAMMDIPHRLVQYGQTAMVCTIRHSEPHQGLALERFLPAGPFAVLPMQDDCSGIVWSEPHERARQLTDGDEATFLREMKDRIGDYLGEIELVSKRYAYPLALVLAKSYTAKRFALIGDAAHAIHPIAGQGVNLGYRDVAALHALLSETAKLGLDIGSDTVLARYNHWRRTDVLSMIAATDGINRLFSNDIPPLRMIRRLGLSLVEKTPKLKHYFMFHAMGLTGNLPDMLKKDKAA